MKIDIFTTIAQLVNFLLLAMLLKRFLYRPIVRTMDERERQIAQRISEARLREKKAQQEAKVCHEERSMLEDRRGEMLSQAQQEADTWKRKLMEKGRLEADESKARWHAAIQREQESFLTDLKRRAGEETYAVARQALIDLAGEELERRMIDVFIKRVEAIPGDEWTQIAAAAERSPEGAVVSSAFLLDGETRSRILAAIDHQIDKYGGAPAAGVATRGLKIAFEQSPDLISGIELIAGGRRAAWSLENYLETLEERLSLAFKFGVGGGEESSLETSK